MKILSTFIFAISLSGCGLVNPGSKGYFQMSGDAHGVSAFVDGFSHQDAYWKHRSESEAGETTRALAPSWLTALFSSKGPVTPSQEEK